MAPDSTKANYTDGGVFQNQPLGMAKNLVETVPGGRLNAADRGILASRFEMAREISLLRQRK